MKTFNTVYIIIRLPSDIILSNVAILFSACDEKKKDGFIRVIVAIKNLETSTDIVRKGFLPKTVKKPSNAKLDMVFENQ